MRRTLWSLSLSAAAMLAGACGGAEAPSVAPVSSHVQSELRAWNGRAWNGRAWNGRAWNGRAWNGRAWNGTSMGATGVDGNGWRAVGASGAVLPSAALTLSGTTLLVGGQSIAALGGSVVLSVPGQPELAFRIDGPSAIPTASGAPSGLSAYLVFGAFDSGWEPLFTEDDDVTPSHVIPVAGEWNTAESALGTPQGGAWSDGGRITFAARGFALAKCVEMGYAGDRHRACVRMLRADYCGDGNSWTANGTLLNVYDNAGIQSRDTAAKWRFEAEWGPHGALCVETYRIEYSSANAPRCGTEEVTKARKASSCGKTSSGFGATGTALMMTDWAKP